MNSQELMPEQDDGAWILQEEPRMIWICPYCGTECPSGYEPTAWAHCGEVGHTEQVEDNDDNF